jgi:hypothetical protein
MAHANPEFALGLMRPEKGPVSHQLPAPASLMDLRRRMIEIGDLIAIDYPVMPEEREAYRIWRALQRQSRAHQARDRVLTEAVSERSKGMHGGGRADERVHEPFRRAPLHIQAGREKVSRIGTIKHK